MIAYIFKSSLSLLILFGLYWFLLRKEKLLNFNRFFLILSIIVSLIIPFITIPVNFQIALNPEKIITVFDNNIPDMNPSQNIINQDLNQSFNEVQPSRINISKVLMILYISGVVLLVFRFLKNIYFISHQIKTSEKINYEGHRIVMMDYQANPYCFFNTIFISKHDYLNDNINNSLLNHELEHIRQSHSIDIVFVELIQIFYWFNPILLLYNRTIRVNHEYLADNGVIRDHFDIKSYSDKLLSFISCKKNVPLTSGFNQSLTKKRLIMMTKSESKSIISGLRITLTLSLILVFSLTISFKQSKLQSIKMVFIPQGQFNAKMIIIGSDTLRNANVSVEAFYMSNEITNKEYREFTDWAKKNTNDTLYQANYTVSVVSDSKRGVTKDTIIRKLTPIKVSEILNDLIDLSALYKLDNKYKDYFTDKRYDDYPVVGVSKKMVEYYCIWKTDTENKIREEQGLPKNHTYRVPLETEWEYVAQQSSDNINKSKKATTIQKSDEGIPDIWGLAHLGDNVSEWITQIKETNGIVRGGSWKTDNNISDRQVCDPNFKDGTIGFRIVQSYLSPLPSGANTATQLNQVELFKQFLGKWTYEMAKDTTYTWECKSYGDELETYLKYETKGKIIMEQKGLFGYNKKSDKMTGVIIGNDNRPLAMWFTTKNVCEVGPILDNSNPVKVTPYRKLEFKSSDILTISLIVNNKYVNPFTLTREKKWHVFN